jgi:thiamine-monophosphate kinase
MGEDLFRTENEFVQWLLALAAPVHGHERVRALRLEKGVKLGIGDDAALLAVKSGHELILTTDMSIEDVHFSHRLHPAEAVGHRALARSLSDVAAMGGVPRYVLVSLAISRQVTRDWVSGFYRGMQALARRFGVRLVGGDTALVPGRTFIDVLVAGEVRRGKALRRSGARTGDQIFVSGRLGLSALGLRLLQSKQSGSRLRAKAATREAVHAHLYPEPQCALGRFLSGRRTASALMDLSDGLSTDLSRLCTASGVGARLWAAKIPGPNLPEAADSLQLALHGGEDYQLLFTVPQREASRLRLKFQGRPFYHLGEIEASKGIKLVMPEGNVHTLKPAGWDYFR